MTPRFGTIIFIQMMWSLVSLVGRLFFYAIRMAVVMLVKLYVGEDRNLNVKVCWLSMLVSIYLHVGEKFEQKLKCMLV